MSNEPTAILRYPYEAITEKTDFLQLSIFKYNTVNKGEGSDLASTSFQNKNPYSSLSGASQATKNKVLIDNGIIALPMPSNIQDTNSVSYEAGQMNKFASIALGAVGDIIDNTNIFSPQAGEKFISLMGRIGNEIQGSGIDDAAFKMVKKSLAVTGQLDDPKWQKYLAYKPTSIGASEDELRAGDK